MTLSNLVDSVCGLKGSGVFKTLHVLALLCLIRRRTIKMGMPLQLTFMTPATYTVPSNL